MNENYFEKISLREYENYCFLSCLTWSNKKINWIGSFVDFQNYLKKLFDKQKNIWLECANWIWGVNEPIVDLIGTVLSNFMSVAWVRVIQCNFCCEQINDRDFQSDFSLTDDASVVVSAIWYQGERTLIVCFEFPVMTIPLCSFSLSIIRGIVDDWTWPAVDGASLLTNCIWLIDWICWFIGTVLSNAMIVVECIQIFPLCSSFLLHNWMKNLKV